MIDLQQHPEGCILRVRAQPRAKRCAVTGSHSGALKVAVTAAPEQGKANKALIATLAEQLHLRKADITLLSGQSSRDKQFLICNISPAALRLQIESFLCT